MSAERTLIYIGDSGDRGHWLDCSENAKGLVTDPQPGDLVYIHLSSPQCQENLLRRGLRLVRAGNGYARIVRLPDEEGDDEAYQKRLMPACEQRNMGLV